MMEELDAEMREHIERETQDNVARGMVPEEARGRAFIKFGNLTRAKEETREVWSFVWVEQLWQDIAVRCADAAQGARVYGGGADAGPGNRREYGDFFGRQLESLSGFAERSRLPGGPGVVTNHAKTTA